MEADQDTVEVIRVDAARPEAVSSFLELGRAYSAELDSTPAEANERFLQGIVRRQVEPDRWLFLHRHSDACIGFVHAKIDRDERPGTGYILEFFVVPENRERGWGRRIFDHVAEVFRCNRVSEIWLTTNPRAEAFWEHLGFAATGEIQNGQRVMIRSI